jgi:GNAT superfamily N-acetyltransferase
VTADPATEHQPDATGEFTVRPRLESDLDELVEILRRVQAATGYPVQMPPDPERWLASSRTRMSWVAVHRAALAGQISLATTERDFATDVWTAALGCEPADLAVVKRLFVDPPLTGRGAARLLLDTAVAEAHRQGLVPVLDVDATSTRARRLYELHGFRLVGTKELTWTGLEGSFLADCYVGPPPAPPRG